MTTPHRTERAAGVLLLLVACGHEFAWQAWPAEAQGDIEAITRWPLVAVLAGLLAMMARSPFLKAACAAVALMCTTTAGCSAAWLISPWVVSPGDEQCSAQWGFPMLLVSGLAAVLVLIWWPHDPEH